VEAILDNRERNLFLEDFIPFAQRVARLGVYNSLAQTLLKFTMPGVPDIYQGNELWDLSLVDPDNRRPVDYALRSRMLDDLIKAMNAPAEALPERARGLLEKPQDGRIKMYLTWKLLGFRRERPGVFRDGDYQALDIRGSFASHLCSFARQTSKETLIAVAPRLLNKITAGGTHLPLGERWADTAVRAPPAVQSYTNVLTGESVSVEWDAETPWLSMRQVLTNLPIALLVGAV
jgi:(1->4)-alpha-D-glucan 1-alpha-D-glucosylmutase